MSQRLVARSADLQRLRSEGYDLVIEGGNLLIRDVPYVKADRTVDRGILVSGLDVAADTTVVPKTHVVLWTGEYPCRADGSQMTNVVNQPTEQRICEGVVTRYMFSQRPPEGYPNYYAKMTTYVHILENEAHAIDPSVTACTFPVVTPTQEESVFNYLDTASSRAGIGDLSERLAKGKVAIVGLGGTGSYILDHLAKTPIPEIHLFDADRFLQHNAFRSPGAPSIEDLGRHQRKVDWYVEVYSKMRRNIVPHPVNLEESNVSLLEGMAFVFVCLDKAVPRRLVATYLAEHSIPFIDTGMGLGVREDGIDGLVRVTTCTPQRKEHLATRLAFSDTENDDYSQDVQISDLNALNAALAVIKWKKLWGLYVDVEHEHNATYGLPGNLLTNDEYAG